MERYFTNTPDVEISDRLCEGTLMAIIKEAYKVKQNPKDVYKRQASKLPDWVPLSYPVIRRHAFSMHGQ